MKWSEGVHHYRFFSPSVSLLATGDAGYGKRGGKKGGKGRPEGGEGRKAESISHRWLEPLTSHRVSSPALAKKKGRRDSERRGGGGQGKDGK